MKLSFKDVLYRHKHLLVARINDNRGDDEDKRNLKELNYLLQCLREYKTQDSQMMTISNRMERKL